MTTMERASPRRIAAVCQPLAPRAVIPANSRTRSRDAENVTRTRPATTTTIKKTLCKLMNPRNARAPGLLRATARASSYAVTSVAPRSRIACLADRQSLASARLTRTFVVPETSEAPRPNVPALP